MRHPQWQTDTPAEEFQREESFNDSLRDVQDMSLRLSVDGEKSSFNGSLDYSASSADREVQEQVRRVLSKMQNKDQSDEGIGEQGRKVLEGALSKYPVLRRRRRLVVIAVDCYDNDGNPDTPMVQMIQDVIKAVRSDPQTARVSGFALSTAMPMSETVRFLAKGKIQVNEFDALICSSGSEVYYPGTYTEEDGRLFPDPDYASHIKYRWGYEGLKRTIWKLCTPEGDEKMKESPSPVAEDKDSCNSHCVSYIVKDITKVCRVDLKSLVSNCEVRFCVTNVLF